MRTRPGPPTRVLARLTMFLLLAVVPGSLGAQANRLRPVQLEARADGLVGRRTAGHLGGGANVAVGNYLRAGLVVAGGATRGNGDELVGSARADLVGRFLLDPFREHAWGPYAGAGLGVLWDEEADAREVVLLVIGAEGGMRSRVRPAIEVGFGGGTRIGIVLRWGRPEAR